MAEDILMYPAGQQLDDCDNNTHVLPGRFLVVWLCVGIVVGVIMLFGWHDSAQRIEEAGMKFRQNTLLNNFFKDVDKGTTTVTGSIGLLRDDLRIFMEARSEVVQNDIYSPVDIGSISLPEGRYSNLYDEVGCIARTDLGDDLSCGSVGYLRPDFVTRYNLAYSHVQGELTTAKIEPVDKSYYLLFGHLGVIRSLIIILGIGWLCCAFVIIVTTGEDNSNENNTKFHLNEWQWWAGMLLATPWYLIGFIPTAVFRHKEYEKQRHAQSRKTANDIAARLRREQGMKNNPLKNELRHAYENRIKLQPLLDQFPTDKKIKTAFNEVDAVVKELEKFPETYSLATAQYLAAQIANDTRTVTDAIPARMQALDEIKDL